MEIKNLYWVEGDAICAARAKIIEGEAEIIKGTTKILKKIPEQRVGQLSFCKIYQRT